jgi:NTP pyrophosphatase (non-canonical NTP hydrolase)
MQYLLGEVRELCEAYMVKGNAHQGNIGIAKKSGDYTPLKNTIEDELADIFIIALGICGYYNVDILWWVKQKMAYNATRTDKKHLENIRGNNGKKTI